MTKSKRHHPERDFTPTHPDAAAIDIGSRMHVAAVPTDRDSEPVCVRDLHRRFAAIGRLVRALRCISAPKRDPSPNRAQFIEIAHKNASLVGSRSAPMGPHFLSRFTATSKC